MNKKRKIEEVNEYPLFTNKIMPSAYTAPAIPDNAFRILSYNIAGLVASTKKGLVPYLLAENADIVCLQESKLSDNPAVSIIQKSVYPYQYLSHSTEKKGYSGTIVLSKHKPVSVKYGMGKDSQFDKEGRIITLEFNNFYLINSYIPNAGQDLKRLDYKLEYNKAFSEYLDELDAKKPVVWAGGNCFILEGDLHGFF